VAVQHDLRTERGMTGKFKRNMPPIRIHDVKRIVFDERSFGFQVLNDTLLGPTYLPDRGRRSCDQNHEQTSDGRIFLEILLGNLVLPIVGPAVDNRNPSRLSIATNPAAKPSGHPHQVGVVQLFFRAIVELPPPGS